MKQGIRPRQGVQHSTRAASTSATPAPMLGRLPVDFDLVGGSVTEPLAEVPTGTLVTATGTITNALAFPGGRTSLTVTNEQGASALIVLDAHVLQMASFRAFRDLGVGDVVAVAGTVARRSSGVAVVDGLELWAVTR